MRVIVTGATGFVGREIVGELARKSFTVFSTARTKRTPPLGTPENSHNIFENFIAADIADYSSFEGLKTLKNIDAVIHSAGLAHQFGETAKEMFDAVNVEGTKNALRLAAELNAVHFILISSTAVYGIKKTDGRHAAAIDEETKCAPDTLYAASKLEAELFARDFCSRRSLPLTVLRLAPVLGEGNVGNAARLVEAIDKRRFMMVGDGENLKTLIYKKDVAAAAAEILREKDLTDFEPEIFNLAANPVTINEFVGEIAKSLHKNILPVRIPFGLMRSVLAFNEKKLKIKKITKISATLEKWLSDDVYSAQKIKDKYGFVPPTTTAEAIEKQVGWYLRRGGK